MRLVVFLAAFIFQLLTFGIAQGVATSDEKGLYLYDVSMLDRNDGVLNCPELKIDLNEIDSNFEPGDKLFIRLQSDTRNKDEKLSWYYPPIHGKETSFIKRAWEKVSNLSFDFRFKKMQIRRKIIRFPMVRIMSSDILGNSRSKVGSKLNFTSGSDGTIFYVTIEDEIQYGDFIRLRNLHLYVQGKPVEIGPTIIECSKNLKNWKRLENYKFVVGKTSLTDVVPNRFLRSHDKKYPITIGLGVGEYPTIDPERFIELELSDEIEIEWSDQSKVYLTIHSSTKTVRVKVDVDVSGKTLRFHIPSKVEATSRILIEDIYVKSTAGSLDPPSVGYITLHTQLTGNFDIQSAQKRTQLGERSDPISLLYPHVSILEREELTFFLKSDNSHTFSLQIKNDNRSMLRKDDQFLLIIPDDVELTWSSSNSGGRSGEYSLYRKDRKTLEVNLISDLNSDLLQMTDLEFDTPSHSIRPFNIELHLPFTANWVTIPQLVSFGQPKMFMSDTKLINRENEKSNLNDIHFFEDAVVQTLRKGDAITIHANSEFYQFDPPRFADIEIETGGKGSGFEKLGIDYASSDKEKIVLYTKLDFEPNDAFVIKNIPITDFANPGSDIHLVFSITDECILIDEKELRFFDLSLRLPDHSEFIRDISNPTQILKLPPLTIQVSGNGRTFSRGEKLVLQLPSGIGNWTNGEKFRIRLDGPASVKIERPALSNVSLRIQSDLYDKTEMIVEGLEVLPLQQEFVKQSLRLYLVSDTTLSTAAKQSITFSYPSITSLDNQTFFTDDTSWALYNFDINTRNLDHSFPPGARVSILLSEDEVEWDIKVAKVTILGDNRRIISDKVFYEGQRCVFTVLDSLREGSSFEVSGLRVRQVRKPMKNFTLQLSLDEGESICAKDVKNKRVVPDTEYDKKIERSLDVARYSLITGKKWLLSIPSSAPFDWDSEANQIIPAKDPSHGIMLGNFTTKSLSSRIEFIDTKTAQIRIEKGYKEISQGLELSGSSPKKIVFGGLKMNRISKTGEIRQDFSTGLELKVETPYGSRTIRSDRSGHPDWGFRINRKKIFKWNTSSGASNLPIEIEVFTPAIKDPSMGDILSGEKLLIYGDHEFLLKKPLLEDWVLKKESEKRRVVLQSAGLIGQLYDTPKKGRIWKTWYYLALAKRRAIELKIFGYFIKRFDPVTEKALMASDYLKDLEKAKSRGYDPEGYHREDYPFITEDPRERIRQDLLIAENRAEQNQYLEAERDFLDILAESENYERTKDLAAVANYWLGRIALVLGDTDYEKYTQSYAFRRLRKAYKIYSQNRLALDQLSPTLKDSIKKYTRLARNIGQQRESATLKRVSPYGERKGEFGDNYITFTFVNDNEYTFQIEGEGGFKTRVLSSQGDKSLLEDDEVQIGFERRFQLNKGGTYTINFSPSKQSYWNLLATTIILASLALFYG